MIKIENIKVYNIARAVYSSRNAMNSWDKSDSDLEHDILGENDLDLAKRLYKAGTEFDTYKVGTTANSCSTMHKIHAKEFTLDDFSHEHLNAASQTYMDTLLYGLNKNRDLYLKTKKKDYWWQMIQLLPSSYNQRRTITMNYENVMSMINQREGHKLDEWREMVSTLRTLPYVKEIRGDGGEF